jgi:hypothetical protein
MYSRRWLIAAVAAWMLASACSQFNTNLSLQTSSSSVSFVSPATVTAGESDFTLTVNGSGFVTGAFILWNGAQLADTVFVSSTTMTAVVPASDVATPGQVQVSVQIPGSAVSGTANINNTPNSANTTEVSNIVFFNINPAPGPLPVISSVSASTTSMPATPYCSPTGFTLTVNGTNFTSDSVVNWTSGANSSTNGSARATTFVSSTKLTAAILPSDAAFPGTAGVSVSAPSGPSNTAAFTMTTPGTSLPPPSIISLSQSLISLNPPVGTATSVPAGSPAFTLSVTGSSLVPCTVVQWNGSPRTTTFVSTTQINAAIPASDVVASGTANVSVTTPTPGGGAAGPVAFTITH